MKIFKSIIILFFLFGNCLADELDKDSILKLYDEMQALDRAFEIEWLEVYSSQNSKVSEFIIKMNKVTMIYRELDRIAFIDKLNNYPSRIDWSNPSIWSGFNFVTKDIGYLSKKYPEFKQLHYQWRIAQTQIKEDMKKHFPDFNKVSYEISKKNRSKLDKIEEKYISSEKKIHDKLTRLIIK